MTWFFFAGDDGLNEEAKRGEHGEPDVFDVLDLKFNEGLGVFGEAEGVVETFAEVDGVDDVSERPVGDAIALNGAHEEDSVCESSLCSCVINSYQLHNLVQLYFAWVYSSSWPIRPYDSVLIHSRCFSWTHLSCWLIRLYGNISCIIHFCSWSQFSGRPSR